MLVLGKDERDLIILRHTLGISWPDNRKEIRGVNLVVYGDATYSAMAKTVGYPAAIAAKMILDGEKVFTEVHMNTLFGFFLGEIQERGAILPFATEIYRPILSRLRAEGLNSSETSKIY